MYSNNNSRLYPQDNISICKKAIKPHNNKRFEKQIPQQYSTANKELYYQENYKIPSDFFKGIFDCLDKRVPVRGRITRANCSYRP